jgi:hypothetical protein
VAGEMRAWAIEAVAKLGCSEGRKLRRLLAELDLKGARQLVQAPSGDQDVVRPLNDLAKKPNDFLSLEILVWIDALDAALVEHGCE